MFDFLIPSLIVINTILLLIFGYLYFNFARATSHVVIDIAQQLRKLVEDVVMFNEAKSQRFIVPTKPDMDGLNIQCCNCGKRMTNAEDHNYQMGSDDYGVKLICSECGYKGVHFQYFKDEKLKIIIMPVLSKK